MSTKAVFTVLMVCYPTGKMGIFLGDIFPNFDAETTHGNFTLHDWIGDGWAILISYPLDYTPVATTELGHAESIKDEFAKRNVKLIALSLDSVEDHNIWIKDIQDYAGLDGHFSIPIIADPTRELALQLGLLDPTKNDSQGLPLIASAVFVIGPGCKLMLSQLYPATTGRNFDEMLRVVDSLQLTMYTKVATPVNWKRGEYCMVDSSVKQEDVGFLFPMGVKIKIVPSGKSYMKVTPEPSD